MKVAFAVHRFVKRHILTGIAMLSLFAVTRMAVLVAASLAAGASGIQFVEDDYPAGLAQARSEGKPLLVDTWASWCHTCLSMKRYVLTDPGLRPVKDAVIWLSIDSENPKNKVFLERFPLDAWPTFLIIDPTTEGLASRWIGAATVNDFRAFVQDGVRIVHGEGGSDPATTELQRGHQARETADFAGAVTGYRRALELTRAGDPARPERLIFLAMALYGLKSTDARRECVQLGLKEVDNTGDSAVAADFVAAVDACAETLAQDDRLARELREKSIARLERLVIDPAAPLSVDDRSDAQATLMRLLDISHRHERAVQVAQARAKLLEEAAAKAPNAAMASTFDAHRTDTYLYLSEPLKAEQLLKQRERDVPDDYNPPARLARVLFEEKKFDEAETAVDRALSRMTRGPRRVGILALKARILEKQGKPTETVVREQLDVLRELPRPQRSPELEARLQKKLTEARPQ